MLPVLYNNKISPCCKTICYWHCSRGYFTNTFVIHKLINSVTQRMFTFLHLSHVTCHLSHVTCHVSKVIFFFFFGQRGEASRWRVCYQRRLPRLTVWLYMFGRGSHYQSDNNLMWLFQILNGLHPLSKFSFWLYMGGPQVEENKDDDIPWWGSFS